LSLAKVVFFSEIEEDYRNKLWEMMINSSSACMRRLPEPPELPELPENYAIRAIV
jgi:hypothetical protein